MWTKALKFKGQLIKQCVYDINKNMKDENKVYAKIMKLSNGMSCRLKNKNSIGDQGRIS